MKNNKFTLLILGVVAVTGFWISWVSLNPSDDKAMATFVSVNELLNEHGHAYEYDGGKKKIFGD